MIYLYVENEGWKEFEITDTEELKKRNIVIGYGSSIGYGSRIGDGSSIGSRSRIGSRSSIGDGSRIGDGSSIGDNVVVKSFSISGSKHLVAYWGENAIQIGCIKKTVEEWLTGFEQVGVENDYTTEQITEYGNYINIIANYHKSCQTTL